MRNLPKVGKALTDLRLIDLPFQLYSLIAENRPTALSSRSRCMHALYGPLSDFGLDPSNGARSQPDGWRKALFPNQLVDVRFREARDRFYFW